MAKDPAFLFYSSDFLTGTHFFTDEQVGKYIRLLCYQHLHGHLTKKQMLQICGEDQEIFDKFFVDKNGNFYNKRLDDEARKRKQHSEHQRNNVMKRWKKRKYVGNTMVLPLENENENENNSGELSTEVQVKGKKADQGKKAGKDRKPKKFIAPTEAEVREYFSENGYKPECGSKAFRFYATGGWIDSRGSPVKNWKQKMIAVWFKDENKLPPPGITWSQVEEKQKEIILDWNRKNGTL